MPTPIPMENTPEHLDPNTPQKPVRENDPLKKATEKTTSFLQYSGLGLQMLVTIGAGVWLGSWLDERQGNHTPVWTLVLALVSIAGSIYLLIRGLPKQS